MNICVIPARKHSKRLPCKNMMLLAGKPLVQWTIEQAKDSGVFDLIIVSTDWEEIALLASDMNVVIRNRPYELATDEATVQDVIIDAIEEYKPVIKEGACYCLLQPTSPLRQIKDILNTKKLFTEDVNSLFTINESTLDPNGLIYWFRDYTDIWKKPSFIHFTYGIKNLDIDYVWGFRIAEHAWRFR